MPYQRQRFRLQAEKFVFHAGEIDWRRRHAHTNAFLCSDVGPLEINPTSAPIILGNRSSNGLRDIVYVGS